MPRVAYVAAALIAAALAVPARAAAPPPDAVVAVIDTGIDPYHAAFRDRSARAYAYPGTYLPGYPTHAVALRLTLDTKDYWSAVRADCQRVWRHVKPGVLYWFPGTTIVGAISFDRTMTGTDCAAPHPTLAPILDEVGHGTMTASRAAGAHHGACPRCRLVSVQFQTGYGIANDTEAETSAVHSVSWAGANASWIDAESNSWAPLPAWDPTGTTGLFTTSPTLARTVESASRAHLAFWASTNGIGGVAGLLGHPTVLRPNLTPSAIIVGGQDSGRVETWPGFTPHVVSDACSSWAALGQTTAAEGADVGGGTSGATPYAAGLAAADLAYARKLLGDRRTGVHDGAVARGPAGRVKTGPLADGVLTLAEWRAVLYATATARPVAQADDGPTCGDPLFGSLPVAWASVPATAPAYPLIGYGAVDRPAQALAQRVLSGAAAAPDRSDVDTYFTVYGAAQGAAYTVFRGP